MFRATAKQPSERDVERGRDRVADQIKRSLIIRVSREIGEPEGQSGTAVYSEKCNRSDGTIGPAVVGFISFHRRTTEANRTRNNPTNMSDGGFRDNVRGGHVPFWGLYPLPDDLVQNFEIICKPETQTQPSQQLQKELQSEGQQPPSNSEGKDPRTSSQEQQATILHVDQQSDSAARLSADPERASPLLLDEETTASSSRIATGSSIENITSSSMGDSSDTSFLESIITTPKEVLDPALA